MRALLSSVSLLLLTHFNSAPFLSRIPRSLHILHTLSVRSSKYAMGFGCVCVCVLGGWGERGTGCRIIQMQWTRDTVTNLCQLRAAANLITLAVCQDRGAVGVSWGRLLWGGGLLTFMTRQTSQPEALNLCVCVCERSSRAIRLPGFTDHA